MMWAEIFIREVVDVYNQNIDGTLKKYHHTHFRESKGINLNPLGVAPQSRKTETYFQAPKSLVLLETHCYYLRLRSYLEGMNRILQVQWKAAEGALGYHCPLRAKWLLIDQLHPQSKTTDFTTTQQGRWNSWELNICGRIKRNFEMNVVISKGPLQPRDY